MNDAIDITTTQRKTVLDLLSRHLPDTEVWVYGSRANWTSKPQSDLDMVVFTTPDQSRKVADLKEAFEESNLPFRVDLFAWDEIPDSFKRNIEAEHVVLRNKLKKRHVPPGWAYRKVAEIAEVIGGGTPKTKKDEYWGGDIPWLTPKDLSGEHPRYVSHGERNITKTGLASSSARIVPPKTVLLTSRAPVGYVAMAKNPITTNQGFRSLVVNDENDPEFVYYLLLNNTEYLKQHASGSTFQELSGGTLKSLEFLIPPLPEQKAIAHILGTLDDKIELNRRMNETLENIARTIFKSWFIDFDPVIDNALRAGNPIPDSMAERAEVRRRLLDQNQPSPPAPLPKGEGSIAALPHPRSFSQREKEWHFRGGYDFSGLVEKARELRKKQTPAEDLFWELVRDRRFMDLKFRRQHQLGDYVADFYCHEHRLVIELDGGVHDAQHKKDRKRDAWMKAQGYTVLRFKNEQLLDDPESVLNKIAGAIPGSSPSGRGGGEGLAEISDFHQVFPDGFEDSALGEIPKGWSAETLTDFANVIGGGTPKTSIPEYWGGNIPWFSVVDTPSSGDLFVVSTEKSVTQAGIDNSSAKVLESGTVIITARGTVGNLALTGVPMAMNQSCYALRDASNPNGYFLYFSIAGLLSTLKARTHGSVFDTITRNTLSTLSVLVPPGEVRDAFESMLTPLMGQMLMHLRETATLQDFRGLLLPALLNGSIALPERLQNVGRTL